MVQFTDLKITTELTQKNEELPDEKGSKPEESNTEKNKFEEMLTQIRQLLKGKKIAESGKSVEELINISINQSESCEKNETQNESKNKLLSHELFVELIENKHDKEKNIPSVNELSLVKANENIELKSVSIGMNTQIITTKGNTENTEQILNYAKKIGLNEKAIYLLFKNDLKNRTNNFEGKNIEKSPDIKKTDDEQLKLLKKAIDQSISNFNTKEKKISDNANKRNQFFNNLKNKNFNGQSQKNNMKIEIEEQTTDSEKMLMKLKNEAALEKLVIKKIKENPNLNLNKNETIETIDLKNRLSELLKTISIIKKSEIISQSNSSNNEQNLSNMTNSSLGSSFLDQNSQNQQNLTKESNPESSLLKRQEQYQQLSQRLGESVARRIISQIARGSWNIKIALKPASLGSIDISLNLRGKEIEASFLVNQALTKELLTDSLPKLKELLEKSGINVAHVDINEKKHDKNDENSTNKKNDNYVIKDKSKEVEVDKKEQNNSNNIITSEGLNILV